MFQPARYFGQIILSGLLLCSASLHASPAPRYKCLYVSSYHQGYAWSDGVERGLRSVLSGQCTIKQYDMDTKRNRSEASKQQAARQARTLIEQWQPDIVITADDNAVQYLLQQYYRDSTLPFVFCGVNWTASEYGLPYRNATGIIEVAPIRPLLRQVKILLGNVKTGVYIGADTVTERKNFQRFAKMAKSEGINLKTSLVATTAAWLHAYQQAQQADFIVIGSNAGIEDWNPDAVSREIANHSTRLTITNHDWMMPYSMLGFTKVPEEQGELAGRAALSILNGAKPESIAIVPNRKWDIWTHSRLLKTAGIVLPELLLRKSKQIR